MKLRDRGIGARGAKSVTLGVALFAGVNACISGLKLVLIPLYTRVLDPGAYGILGTANIITLLLILLMSSGVERAVLREYFDYRDSPQRLSCYLRTVLVYLASRTGIAAVIVWAVIGTLDLFHIRLFSVPYVPYVVVTGAIAGMSGFYSVFMSFLQAKEDRPLYVLSMIGKFLVMVAVTLVLVLERHMGAVGVLLGELAGTALMSVVLAAIFVPDMMRAAEDEPRIKPEIIRGTLVYGMPFVMFELGGWVLVGLDRIILGHFRSLAEVGIYTVGATLAQGVGIVTSALNMVYSPYFFRTAQDGGGPHAGFPKVMALYVTGIGAACLGAALFSREIFRIIAPVSYAGSETVFSVLLISSFFWGLYNITVLPLLHLKETGRLPFFIAAAMAVSFCLNLALDPCRGATGAATASATAYAVLFLLAFRTARKRYALRYPVFAFWGMMVAYGGAAVLAYHAPFPVRIAVLCVAIGLGAVVFLRTGRVGRHTGGG